MNINVRRGVFETNSSSMHSFHITGKDRYVDADMERVMFGGAIQNGELRLGCDDLEYGWGYDEVHSFKGKLGYILATYYQKFKQDDDKMDEFLNDVIYPIVKKVHPDFDELVMDGDPYYKYGYIDHQSYGEIFDFLREQDISIEEFLLNTKYYIVIDNDNH